MCSSRTTVQPELPVHVLRMMQWSMMGLQLTVISKQWCALWCWADLSSGLNCRRRQHTESDVNNHSKSACEPIWSFFKKMNALHL